MKIRNPSTTTFQGSDGATQIQASDDVNLAKFRKEAGDNFLGLGINGWSRKIQKAAINLGKKCVKGIEGWGAINLGIGGNSSSNNYKINHGRALNPTPLSSYHPTQGYKVCSSSSDHGASSSSCFALLEQKENLKNNNVKKKKKGGPKRSRVDDESLPPEPTNPPQELLQMIGPSVRPVFLYRKQLAKSDTLADQNRLFVNDRKRLMDFMTEEERLAVEDPKKPGCVLFGIDRNGKEYELHTKKWKSLDKVVVKKGWHRIIAANGPRKGIGFISGLFAMKLDSACLSIFVNSPDHTIDHPELFL